MSCIEDYFTTMNTSQSPTKLLELLSHLKPFSIGIVAQDKAQNSDEVLIWPAEQLPFTDGGFDDTNVLKCLWILNGNSNRYTSPDVCEGETVQIYRYADTDRYYWHQVFREPKMRDRERVLYLFSNTDKGVESTMDNSYWLMVDTFKKIVHLHMSDNDGEIAGFDFIFDGSSGVVSLLDTKGNKDIFNATDGTRTFEVNKDVSIIAGQGVLISCQNAIVQAAQSATIDSPTTTVQGDLVVTGNAVFNQDVQVEGSMSASHVHGDSYSGGHHF